MINILCIIVFCEVYHIMHCAGKTKRTQEILEFQLQMPSLQTHFSIAFSLLKAEGQLLLYIKYNAKFYTHIFISHYVQFEVLQQRCFFLLLKKIICFFFSCLFFLIQNRCFMQYILITIFPTPTSSSSSKFTSYSDSQLFCLYLVTEQASKEKY